MVVVAATVAVTRAVDMVEDGCLRQRAKFLEMCPVRVGASISTMWVVITVPGESPSLSYRNKLKVVATVVVADMVVVAATVAVTRAVDMVEDGCLRQRAKFLEMCPVRVGASISTMWVVITVPGESLSLSYRNKLKEVAE